MKTLSELISIIKKDRPYSKLLLLLNLEKDTISAKLLLGICKYGWEDEETALKAIFGTPDSNPSFSRAKRQLRDRLMDAILTLPIDSKDKDQYDTQYYELYKSVVQIKFLLRKDARRTAVYLAERVLKQVEKTDLTSIGLEVAIILRHHYGTIIGSKQKFDHYNALVEECLQRYVAEVEGDGHLEELYSNYVRGRAHQEMVHELAQVYEQKLLSNPLTSDSLKLQHRLRMIQVVKWSSAHNYEEALQVSKNALDYLGQQDRVPSSMLRSFLYQIIVSALQLRKISEGRNALEKLSQLVNPKSSLAFRVSELRFSFAMHTHDYDEAASIYVRAISHNRFSSIYPVTKELWYIFHGFVSLLRELNMLRPDTGRMLDDFPFRSAKFLNQVPTFSQDKRGLNIAILILQIFFLLIRGAYSSIVSQLDALKRYSNRYLRENESTFRSYCFIQILIEIPDAHYSTDQLVQGSQKWIELLRSNPIQHTKMNFEIEVLSYEVMLEKLLGLLDQNSPDQLR